MRFARDAIELVGHGAAAVLVGHAHIHEADEERLAFLDVHADFLARLEAEKEGRGRQYAHVPVVALETRKFGEHFRVHEMAVKIVVGHFVFQLAGKGTRLGL